MYELGIDLGTTFTAAAIRVGDRVDIAPLGSRSPVIPSVVLLAEDGTTLTGDAAQRRALTEPTRVAREFKRRLGDPLPVIVGGAPHSAEALSALLLRSVVDTVSALQGEAPHRVALTHPANWGTYKKELFAQAVRFADLPDAVFLSEPEAAAIHYASQERIDDGSIVAVYDLGGGTFDATVLRKVGDSFEVLGQPEGIERLGGIDFDQAVFTHVAAGLGGALDELDRNDPAALAAVARLRADCIDAKEALSMDTEASVVVALPGMHTEIRITRPELEAMLRRPISDTVAAMRRALRDADVEPSALSAVLLVGGSSRIPMVAEMVGAELGRPVAVDAHPKYTIALGAARYAGLGLRRADDPRLSAAPTPVADAPLVVAPVAVAVEDAAPIPPAAPPPSPQPAMKPETRPEPQPAAQPQRAPMPEPVAAMVGTAEPAGSLLVEVHPPADAPAVVPPAAEVSAPTTTAASRPVESRPTPPPAPPTPPVEPAASSGPEPSHSSDAAPAGKRSRKGLLIGAGVAAVIAIGAGIAVVAGGGDDGGNKAAAENDGGGCPTSGPFVCITSASVVGNEVRAEFQMADVDLSTTNLRFFLDSNPDAFVRWNVSDPFEAQVGSVGTGVRICGAVNDSSGNQIAGSGNCVALGG